MRCQHSWQGSFQLKKCAARHWLVCHMSSKCITNNGSEEHSQCDLFCLLKHVHGMCIINHGSKLFLSAPRYCRGLDLISISDSSQQSDSDNMKFATTTDADTPLFHHRRWSSVLNRNGYSPLFHVHDHSQVANYK